jgi:hypothetical protein
VSSKPYAFNQNTDVGAAPNFSRVLARASGISLGSGNSSQLEIGNAGSGAANISFHREGAYGAHFGLDTDNVFSTYGWSAGGGYTGMRVGAFATYGAADINGQLNVNGGNSSLIRMQDADEGGFMYVHTNSGLIGFLNNFGSWVFRTDNYGNAIVGGNLTVSGTITGTATKANTINNSGNTLTFNWSGQAGQPTWLFGSNDGVNAYVWNPANFSVNYANSAGTLTNGAYIGDVFNTGWYRSVGNAGWYSQTYDGGIYMNDSTWVRVYNNKNFVTGGAIEATAFNYVSDQRLKKEIRPLENSLDKITQLEGVNFKWKKPANEKLAGEQVGFIAQQVEKVFPELVLTKEDGYKSVQYSALVSPLVESVKSLKRMFDDLLNKVNGHDEKIAKLEKENIELKQLLNTSTQSSLKDQEILVLKEKTKNLEIENEAVKNFICQKNASAVFCKKRVPAAVK